jgi:hypothetical protein
MIREDLAPYMDLKGEMGQRIRTGMYSTLVRTFSGVPLMKSLAVSVEPAFGVGTTFRDVNFFGITDPNVTNLPHYNKFVIQHYKKAFADAWEQTGDFVPYAENGGAHGFNTLAGIARVTLGGRERFYEPEFLREPRTENEVRWANNKRRWGEMVNAATKLSVTTEVTNRMLHGKYLRDIKGFGDKESVLQTNQLLNFMRKGPAMRALDDLFAFAGATSQALDGHLRAMTQKKMFDVPIGEGRTTDLDKKTYYSKLGQYALARALFLSVAFALNKDHMIGQTPQKRVNNIILPVPGASVKDENGQPVNLEFKIKLDASPAEALTSVAVNRMFDTAHGVSNPQRDQLYAEELMKSIIIYRLTDLNATAAALLALFGNVDPQDGQQIFKNIDEVAPKDQVRAKDNKLTVLGADLINQIPGMTNKVSPIQVGRAAEAFAVSNNTFCYWLGLPTHEWSYMAENNLGYAFWEVMKPIGKKTFFNYAPADMNNDEDFLFRQAETSPVRANVNQRVQRISDKYKKGEISRNEAINIIANIPQEAGVNALHVKAGLDNLKDRLLVHDKWDFYAEKYPVGIAKIPKRIRMEKASTYEASFKAKWYNRELEKLEDEPEAIKVFNILCNILKIRTPTTAAHDILSKSE